jgi:hypothetical protein
LAALACNLPGSAAPTPFTFPTPDLTLTAIFNPPPAGSPTATLPPFTQPTLTPIGPTSTTQPEQGATPTTNPPTTAAPSNTPVPPTPTPVPPTNTSAPPTSTATQPPPTSRSGPSVAALYVSDPINIDGVMDDWDLERYNIDEVVYGEDRWRDEDDLSARAMFAWDEDYLYISVRVRDDEFVQNARTREIFRGDSLEVLIDTKVQEDYYYRQLSADDFQLGISPGSPAPGQSPEAYLWYPQSIEGKRSDVVIGAESVDGGYYVEVAIPWDVFETTPDEGDHFGFAFSVSDNDRAEENEQQSMVSYVSNRHLTDPTTWGDLQLVD